MKLYSFPLSPYAARVRGAIYAKDLAVEMILPPEDWRTSDAFRAVNPLRRIPVLVLDDGTTVAESQVIVEYLEDAHPDTPLRPTTAEARARVRLVTQIAETYVMGALMPLFGMFDAKTKDAGAIDLQLAKLDSALANLEAALSPKGYAHGDRLSTADVFLTPLRFSLDGLMGFSGRNGLLDRHPRIAGYGDVVQGDRALSRVWSEMTDGLRSFYEKRASAG